MDYKFRYMYIRENEGNLMSLRKAIWSTYFHLLATDKQLSHQLSPDGEDSWCFYRRAQAKNETPPTHALK